MVQITVQAPTPVLRAFANIASATADGPVVNAVAGKKIRVLAVIMNAGATATLCTFKSKPAGASTAISAGFAVGVNNCIPLNFNPAGWFETNTAEGLVMTTGTGSTVGVHVVYQLV